MNFKSHLTDLLKKIGLNESEAQCYLLIQKNPDLTISDLVKKSELSRAQVYRIFEKLRDLGLVASSPGNWRQTLRAASLSGLADKVGREQRKLRKAELELKRLSNLMEFSRHVQIDDPVEIVTDPEMMAQKTFEVLQNCGESFEGYGSAERLIDVIGREAEDEFIRTRRKKGVRADCALTEFGEYAEELMPNNERDLREIRLCVDPDLQESIVYLYKDKATIMHFDKELGARVIVVKEPALVNAYGRMFKGLWKD
jgi:hypothetical protein